MSWKTLSGTYRRGEGEREGRERREEETVLARRKMFELEDTVRDLATGEVWEERRVEGVG